MSSTVKNGEFFVSRTKDAFSLSISCKQDNVLGGISVAVGEVERARQHGFTASELERAKKLYLNAAERQLKMEKDYKNSHYVSLCVNNFLEGEPILTPAYNLYPRQGASIGAVPQGVTIVETPLLNISSTQIRQAILQGESIHGMVPEAIEDLAGKYYQMRNEK